MIFFEAAIFILRFVILLSIGIFLAFQIRLWGKLNGEVSRIRRMTTVLGIGVFVDMARQITTRILILNGIPSVSLFQEVMITVSTGFVCVVTIYFLRLFLRERNQK